MAGMSSRTAEWLRAVRWRRRIEELLGPAGLTFTQWLVLSATSELVRAARDALSQNDVAVHLDMHRSTVSDAMVALASLGLVDRGYAAEGPSSRVFVTAKGAELLAQLGPRLDEASSLE